MMFMVVVSSIPYDLQRICLTCTEIAACLMRLKFISRFSFMSAPQKNEWHKNSCPISKIISKSFLWYFLRPNKLHHCFTSHKILMICFQLSCVVGVQTILWPSLRRHSQFCEELKTSQSFYSNLSPPNISLPNHLPALFPQTCIPYPFLVIFIQKVTQHAVHQPRYTTPAFPPHPPDVLPRSQLPHVFSSSHRSHTSRTPPNYQSSNIYTFSLTYPRISAFFQFYRFKEIERK